MHSAKPVKLAELESYKKKSERHKDTCLKPKVSLIPFSSNFIPNKSLKKSRPRKEENGIRNPITQTLVIDSLAKI